MRLWITLSMIGALIITPAAEGQTQSQYRQRRAMQPITVARNPVRQTLPACTTDSFVHEARNMAENIYGGESLFGPPPFDGFTQDHRINAGFFGGRNDGLTTGHGSQLPDAWGKDEFISEGEMTQSGQRDMSEYASRPLYDYPAYIRSFWRTVERGGLKY